MANKKRIRKLLKKKYSVPVFDPRVVRIFDEYYKGYDFALQFENIAKEAEVAAAAARFRESIQRLKESPLRDFHLEYLNQPVSEREYLHYYISRESFEYITSHKKDMLPSDFYERARIEDSLGYCYTAKMVKGGYAYEIFFQKKEYAFQIFDYRKYKIKGASPEA